MTALLLGHAPGFYVVGRAILALLFGVIGLARFFLGFLRQLRDFRRGS